MRAVIQRVSSAGVTINGTVYSLIGKGLLVFLGIEDSDALADIIWLSNKIINLDKSSRIWVNVAVSNDIFSDV